MNDGFKRHDAGKHHGEQKTSPYPISRLAPVHDLVDVARQIQLANTAVRNVTSSKLRVIAENIRRLQDQAREVLERAQRDAEIHRAECGFSKRPGHIYHLYQRADGKAALSMISPAEWGVPPYEFLGSFRLEADMSWTSTADTLTRDGEDQALQRLLEPALPAPQENGR